jgi:hypothetical protein
MRDFDCRALSIGAAILPGHARHLALSSWIKVIQKSNKEVHILRSYTFIIPSVSYILSSIVNVAIPGPFHTLIGACLMDATAWCETLMLQFNDRTDMTLS